MEQPIIKKAGTMTAHDAFVENMRQMNTVISQMKEIPVLPSEVPKDTSALIKVEFPEAGGIHTFMEGHDQPYRGFPFHEFVEKIDIIKKVVRTTLSGAYHAIKSKPKILLVTLLPSLWIIKPIIRVSVYVFFRIVERFKIKSIRYSQPIRELHRVFSLDKNQNEKHSEREFRLQLRDLLCMTAEFDNAYRYRMQDVLVELDKEALRNNDLKELIRLLDIMQTREKTQEIKDTWKLLKFFIKYYLRFDKGLRTLVVDILSELDLEEIELKIEDKHYCEPRKDYNFGFQLNK